MTWPELADQLQQAVIDEFAVPVSYERLGVTSEITAIFDVAGAVVSADGGSIEGFAPFLSARVDDLPDGHAAHGDRWTVDGVTYEVVALPEDDGEGFVKLRGQRVDT